MRVSKMGMKNVKLSNLDEMYPAQDILMQTNQVKQYGSGVYAYDNIPLKLQDNIEEVIKKHFNKVDCIEVQMPLLQIDEIWKRSGRYDKYIEDGVMMLSETDKGNYCLAPTAEQRAYPGAFSFSLFYRKRSSRVELRTRESTWFPRQ